MAGSYQMSTVIVIKKKTGLTGFSSFFVWLRLVIAHWRAGKQRSWDGKTSPHQEFKKKQKEQWKHELEEKNTPAEERVVNKNHGRRSARGFACHWKDSWLRRSRALPSLSVRTNTNQRSSYFQLSWIHFHSVPCQRPLKIALFFGSTQDIAIYIITRGNSQSSSSTVCACVKCVSCTWRLISCCIATVIIARNRTEYFCGLPLVAFGPHHPYTRRSQHPCPW